MALSLILVDEIYKAYDDVHSASSMAEVPWIFKSLALIWFVAVVSLHDYLYDLPCAKHRVWVKGCITQSPTTPHAG